MPEIVHESPRFRLRTWQESDIDPFMAGLNTPAVMQYLGPLGDRQFYADMYDRYQACLMEFGHCFWIVERVNDNAILGFCGLKRVNSMGTHLRGEFEIGWRLRQDIWGQGYAKEAAIACFSLAFDRFDASIVYAFTIIGNKASWGLMERLGMERRADLDFTDERFSADLNPVIVYSMGKNAWQTQQQ
jgi:RimJ/RimL family protein N-acetyltransferase